MIERWLFWLSGLLFGGAIFSLAYYCRPFFARALAAVEKDLTEKLRRLRVPTRNLHKYVTAWLIAMGCAMAFFWIGLDSLIFAVLISLFIAAVPWLAVRRMAERRRRKIEDQLADSMGTLSNSVKAGLSLPQSLELLASQCPKPINGEFQQIIGEYKMGKTLQQALTEAKERLRSENFALLAASLQASHESGGRLNETVDRIAQSVLELQRLERKVMSETAQARKSAIYMALAPALILLVYYFVDPANTIALFTTVPGQFLLTCAVLLNVIAFFWARAILNPDI
jgi:tight adherence protein B